MAPSRIKLAENVVEQEQWVDPSTLMHELVASQAKGEGEGALFALGGLATGVSTLQ
jgi:hypothetical protein